MQSRHMNQKFGATYPIATGDRYWAVDMIRDRRFFEENAGLLLQIMNKNFSDNAILSGLWCSQGAGHTMNVVAGKSLVKFSVTVPNRTSAWTIPVATEAIDIMKIVEYAGGTNLSLSGIDTGGVNSNYVKLKFIETDGNTRARAKASGTYAYETYPDAVITFGATAPTAYETVLAEFTSNGATLTFVNNGNRQYMGKGQEDVTIYTQADFAAIIERTAANSYRFKQGLTSIYLKALSTGYSIPLSGGDTWGVLLTNYCTRLIAEGGAFLDVGDTASYVAANTDGCVVDGLYIKGTGSVEAAVVQSFLTFAERVTWRNCMTSNRYTNVDFAAFSGGSYRSARYEGCKVYSIDCNTAAKIIRAFYQCYNMNAPYIEDITIANGNIRLFENSYNIFNSVIYNVTNATSLIRAYYNCNTITNSKISSMGGAAGVSGYIFNLSTNISNCTVETLSSCNWEIFRDCKYINGCSVSNVTCSGTDSCVVFAVCEEISNSYIYNIQVANAVTFGCGTCTNLSNVRVNTMASSTGNQAIGFESCTQLSNCYATGCDNIGFSGCTTLTTCQAQSSGVYGFATCKHMVANRSAGSGTKDFHTCKCDYASAVAVTADTAASGWNSGTTYD